MSDLTDNFSVRGGEAHALDATLGGRALRARACARRATGAHATTNAKAYVRRREEVEEEALVVDQEVVVKVEQVQDSQEVVELQGEQHQKQVEAGQEDQEVNVT